MERYLVKVGLSYPTDAAIVRRLLAGEKIPSRDRGEYHARAGDVVDTIPAQIVPGLLAKGYIERIGLDPQPEESSDG